MTNTFNKNPLVVFLTLSISIMLVIQGPMGTGAYFGDTETSVGNIFQAGVWGEAADPFDIVLNEFLPNPDESANGLNFGKDSDSKPLGEWIELYNKGDVDIDVVGWYTADASGGGGNIQQVIAGSNTDTGDTIIPAHGWLVVYMNKAILNNTGDEIHLFTADDVEIDSVTYDDPSDACELDPTPGDENSTFTPTGTPGNPAQGDDCISNQVALNKSYARIPDGTGDWVDPIPTPGGPNELGEEEVKNLPPPTPEGVGEPTENVGFEVEVSDEPLEIVAGTSTPEEQLPVEVSEEPLEIIETTSTEEAEPIEEPVEEQVSEEPALEPEQVVEKETPTPEEVGIEETPESEPESETTTE